MGGVFPIYYNITMGGVGGGVSRDPKFVLRNIWTAPYRKIEAAEKCEEEGSSEQPRWAKPGRTRLAHYLAAAPKVLPKI